MKNSLTVACVWLLVLLVPLTPLFAEQPGGMSLLGVGSASKAGESPWLYDFGKSFVDGFTGALPKLIEAFEKNPGGMLLAIAEVTVLVAVFPELAAIAGVAATAYAAYRAGSDPSKLGEALGEAAFWAVAGEGVGKLLARAERAPRLAAQDTRATEQVFHGTDVANAYREKDEDGLAPRDPQLAPEGRLALAYVAPGAVR
jgi:hypothetical protein